MSKKNIVYIVIIAVFVLIMIHSNSAEKKVVVQAPAPAVTASTQPTIQKVPLTETQCQNLKDEFESVVLQQPVTQTQLGKQLLEQYASNAGLPVVMSNPNVRYVLPQSDCGHNLDTLLTTMIQGAKNGGM